MTQGELADRWMLSESTLARWRSEGIGPIYLKLHGQVRYRMQDIQSFETEALRASPGSRAHQAAA